MYNGATVTTKHNPSNAEITITVVHLDFFTDEEELWNQTIDVLLSWGLWEGNISREDFEPFNTNR